MKSGDSITDVRFTPGSVRDLAAGLVGFASCEVAGLRLDGITVRRTREGRLTLSMPERRDRRGRSHPLIRPVDAEARERLERAILEAIGVEGGAP